eukprot:m.247829 g.247829  ORF g.247829 m.247829 type:complete len:170 (+) comp26662_c0_seq11:152-661(+)
MQPSSPARMVDIKAVREEDRRAAVEPLDSYTKPCAGAPLTNPEQVTVASVAPCVSVEPQTYQRLWTVPASRANTRQPRSISEVLDIAIHRHCRVQPPSPISSLSQTPIHDDAVRAIMSHPGASAALNDATTLAGNLDSFANAKNLPRKSVLAHACDGLGVHHLGQDKVR